MSSASATVLTLDDDETSQEITLVAPGGLHLTILKSYFKYAEPLGLLEMYGDKDCTLFDLKDKLNIHGGNPNVSLLDGREPHTLYGVDDKYYQILVDFLKQYDKDKGVMPTIPDRCTMFKVEVVAPMDYWPLVANLTIQEAVVLDKVAIFFGVDALRLVNELAMAFWIKDNPSRLEEAKFLLKDVIDRDVVIYARQKRLQEEGKEGR